MSLYIKHNMGMLNAGRQLNINTKKKVKTAEKLSSGYRINRAADDAAGLSISEKMRWMIRGLNQGTENALDGISWVQIGDGSLEEAHAMLHRMTELAIKSSNGTNTDDDRAMMQAEFAHLQKEIDRLTDNTTFNEQHIFQEHKHPYHQIEGSTYWPPTQYHTVREGDNDLVVSYAINGDDPLEEVSIKVAAGTYTTKELIDEIDTALEEAGLLDKGIYFQYTENGFCNLNLEGGRIIDEVSGGLSYLLYDNFAGGTLGSLIGTTRYPDDDTQILDVVYKENGYMKFQLLNPEDISDTTPVEVHLPDGFYSKNDLITNINNQIQSSLSQRPDWTGKVEAISEGEIIKIVSSDYIVSEFQGNMFEIDGGGFSSVFYDNIKRADNVYRSPAELMGGYVVRDASYNNTADPEGSVFHFSKGDVLVMNPNGRGELVIDMAPMDKKDIDEVVAYLQEKFNEFEYTDEEGNKQKGAGLTVSKHQNPYTTSVENTENGSSVSTRLAGIYIQSQVKGPESTLGINKSRSSAYAPLFTSQRVTGYQWDARFGENDGKADTNDYLVGLRTLGSMKVEAGKNDSFEIRVGSGNWETITLDADTYGNAAALAAEIQKQVDQVYGADTLKVTATTTPKVSTDPPANRIRIEAVSSSVQGIAVRGHQEADGKKNIGYQEIFQGKVDTPVSVPGSGQPSVSTITLPEVKELKDGKITISPADGNFIVSVDGDSSRNVNLGGKTWTLADLETEIEDAFPPKDTPYTFDDISATGQTKTRTPSAASIQNGLTSSNANSEYYKERPGHTVPNEGDPAKPLENDAPTLTFSKALSNKIKITNANKDFEFILNGNTYKIDLSKDLGATEFATPELFKNALQTAVTKKLGNTPPDQFGGMKVELDNGKLKLTAGLKLSNGREQLANKTSVGMVVNKEGGFVYNLHDNSKAAIASLTANQTTDAASGSSSVSANSSFTGNATLCLVLEKPGGGKETINASVTGGATSYYDLQSKLNQWFEKNGKNLSASVNSNGITVSTTGDWKATGYKLSIDAAKSNLDDKLFAFSNGTLEEKTGASASTTRSNGDYYREMKAAPIEFKEDQYFQMTVDNATKNVKIRKGTYNNWDDMVTEIQTGLDGAFGKDKITVSRTGGALHFATKSANGKNSKIVLNYQEKYNGKQSALRTMFGAKEVGGVDAEFVHVGAPGEPDKVQLKLTRKPYDPDKTNEQEKGTIRVTSNTLGSGNVSYYQGGSFIYPDPKYSDPTPAAGYHSHQNSFMQGVSLVKKSGKVEINKYNNELTFYYSDHYGSTTNSPKKIEFSLAEGMYTPEELVKVLQDKIDDIVGENNLQVLIQNGGIRIETVDNHTGSRYRIHTSGDGAYAPSGSFYAKILSGSKLSQAYSKPTLDHDGKQTGGKVYAMGRQDVKNKITKIQSDGNDLLSLEFTTPDGMKKLEMTLDPGYYNANQLTEQIQKKLDEALVNAGFQKGLIEAVIGYEDPDTSYVYGSINDRALAFKLSDTVAVPKDGDYQIDAIGGTAAFSVFYATDGDIARAYVRGGKDITKGAEIKEGRNVLSLEVDDKPYTVELDAGKYTMQELLDHINGKLKDGNVPLKAYEDGGRLKLMHSKYGQHTIKHLTGGVKNQFFFTEKGQWAGNEPMRLRVSGVSGDWIEVDKPWMDTTSLGINTLTIEKYKNAQKAITRLKDAVTRVSEVRSYFGGLQNRLESTVRNNRNNMENTLAAETRIRDADIAEEAVNNSIHNILEQTGTSMLAQMKQNSQLVLQLLS